MNLNMFLWPVILRLLRHFAIGSFFRTFLYSYTYKGMQHLDYLRQLVLEIIYKIHDNALQINIDSSRGNGTISSSRVFIKKGVALKLVGETLISAVFWVELLAIEEALNFCVIEGFNSDICILSDS